jgi:hypothetical protein
MSSEQNLIVLLQENSDRVAIREVVDNYAFYADTKNTRERLALFTEDAIFEMYNAGSDKPSQTVISKENLRPFVAHSKWDTTMHMNGQSIIKLSGMKASAITYALVHHLNTIDGKQKFMNVAIQYHDQFVKNGDTWLIAERKLFIQWVENK